MRIPHPNSKPRPRLPSQNAAAKLQKEFKNYVVCIKSLQLASKALMDTLSEIYEQEWVGHEQIPVKAQASNPFSSP